VTITKDIATRDFTVRATLSSF